MSEVIKKIQEMVEKKGYEKRPEFEELMVSCKYEKLSPEDVLFLAELYGGIRSLFIRNVILQVLVFYEDTDLKTFFQNAFQKERYLDMRLWAIRGFAAYALEDEVEKMMNKFIDTLKKRPRNTPYNYQEYEQIRSVFGLPYLIKRYGYFCFSRAYEQEEKQYHAMPNAFKGHFTLDELGDYVSLRAPAETTKMLEDFFKHKNA